MATKRYNIFKLDITGTNPANIMCRAEFSRFIDDDETTDTEFKISGGTVDFSLGTKAVAKNLTLLDIYNLAIADLRTKLEVDPGEDVEA